MSQASQAVNRVVDIERRTFSVSVTAIRQDPAKWSSFIHPEVYKDLITNVVFLGAPSTGKTTIAEACARHFNTTWMPEYGREYWEKYNVDRRLSPEQLVELAKGHIEREDEKLQGTQVFVHGYECDHDLYVLDVLSWVCDARTCGDGEVSGKQISAGVFV